MTEYRLCEAGLLSFLFSGGSPAPRSGSERGALHQHMVNVWALERMDRGFGPAALRMCDQRQANSLPGPPFLDGSWLKLASTGDLYRYLQSGGLRSFFTPDTCPQRTSHTLFSPTTCPYYPEPCSACFISPEPLWFDWNIVLLLMVSYTLYFFTEPVVIIILL